MGNNFPRKLAEFVAWAESHRQLWETNQTAIGLTSLQVTAFKARVQQLQSSVQAAIDARQAAKDKTLQQNDDYSDCRRDAGALVAAIKAFAETSGNPNVYALAGVSPNDPPGTAPSPTAPYDLSAGLDSFGNVTLRWKASQPQGVSGVVYVVKRQINATGAFVTADIVGGKEFVDDGVPAGTSSVAYVVTAKRGRDASPPAPTFLIRFGRAPGGGLTIAEAA